MSLGMLKFETSRSWQCVDESEKKMKWRGDGITIAQLPRRLQTMRRAAIKNEKTGFSR